MRNTEGKTRLKRKHRKRKNKTEDGEMKESYLQLLLHL